LKTYYTTDERGNTFTKPKPFNIKEKDVNKLAELRVEDEMKFSNQCTFKPKTLEGVNRNLILEVLEEY